MKKYILFYNGGKKYGYEHCGTYRSKKGAIKSLDSWHADERHPAWRYEIMTVSCVLRKSYKKLGKKIN